MLTYIKELQENSVLDLSMAAWLHEVGERLPGLVKQAQIMGQKYDVVVTNPPYMGSGNMGPKLSNYVKKNYPDTKSDMSTVSMEKTIAMLNDNGYMAMINIPVWMFLSSYEKLRKNILENNSYSSMLHLGRGIFGSDFGTTAFVIGKQRIEKYEGTYRRLFEKQGAVDTVEEKEERFFKSVNSYVSKQENFGKVPGAPIAYWVSQNVIDAFGNKKIADHYVVRNGISSGDNERYLRYWTEVDFTSESWKPCNKGGSYRKWYGNNDYCIYWKDNGHEIRTRLDEKGRIKARLGGIEYTFQEGIEMSRITASSLAFRYSEKGFVYESSTNDIYQSDSKYDLYIALGYFNTHVAENNLLLMNPTVNIMPEDIRKLPFIELNCDKANDVRKIVKGNIEISKHDWDSRESSWNFEKHPLLNGSASIREAYDTYKQIANESFITLKSNEEELNRIFIDIYGLADELPPYVSEKHVTVARIYDTKEEIPDSMKGNNYVLTREDVVKSLISYAVGCMFGRYSLDEPGLICAGGEFDPSKYETYHPDEDAIIPICDDEYFEDDIVDRFCAWLSAAFGKENFMDNLLFIADSLSGGKGLPREVIRNYFLNDFYSDHCKRYQKRPIYWLFDAGKKNSFKALVYLHRYDKDTLARMRTNYVYKQQELYKTRIETTQNRIDTAASQTDKNKFKRELKKLHEQFDEIHVYEEKIHHYADLRQEIDLDDGVKHNYALFADILAKIK